MPESGELNQTQLEQAIKSDSPQQAESLQALEQEKITGDEQPAQNFNPLKTPILYGEGRSHPQRQTKDFVQKHGELTRRREKKHTGRGLHPQDEKERERKAQTVKANDRLHQFEEQEAIREGMVAYEEGKDYLKRDFNTSEEFSIDENTDEFKDFFVALDPNPRERELVDRFLDTNRSIDRLKLLTQMNIADAVTAVLEEKGPGSEYLLRKLSRYRDMMEGKATKIEQQWDYDKGQYVDVEVPMSSDYFTPKKLALGLLRQTLYAEMIGTPELAAVKIATKRLNEDRASGTDSRTSRSRYGSSDDSKPIRSVVELFGYYSGVHRGSPGLYENLCDLYERNYRQVIESQTGESTDDQLEHRAVLMTATMLKDAYSHGGVLNTSASPYNPSFDESVAVGRLGSEPLKRQLRGMRSKIQQTDLHNIGRFIGKSGDDQYGRELRKLHWELEHVPYGQEREEWALRRNVHDIARLDRQHRKRQEAVMFRLEKKKLDIADLDLPDEERELQLQSVTSRHNTELQRLDDEYQVESQRLRTRTPDQLVEELRARQEALKPKHERHKSLAQKALDLHFKFNHHPPSRDDDNSGYYDQYGGNIQIDWINNAPLGLIKRAHRMLERGVSDETVLKYSFAEMISGENGVDRAVLDYVESKLNTINALKKVLQRKNETLNEIQNRDWDDPIRQKAQNDMQQVQNATYTRVNAFNSMLTDRTTTPSVSFEEDGLSPEVIQVWSELAENRDISMSMLSNLVNRGFSIDELKQHPFLFTPFRGDYGKEDSSYTGTEIDWVSNAPDATTKKALSMLNRGESEDEVLKTVLAERIFGEGNVNEETLDVVENKLKAINTLKEVMKIKTEKYNALRNGRWNDPNYQRYANIMQQVQTAFSEKCNKLQAVLGDPTTSLVDSFREDALTSEAVEMWSDFVEEKDVDIGVLAKVLKAGFVVDEIKQYPYLLSPLISEMSQQPQYA